MIQSKVSILIPCYNCESFIDETIRSCINQTYHDIEIVAVDDGSNDATLDKLRAWEQCDTRIKVYTQPNSGAPRARNLAFTHSTGDFIIYLDGDDLISADFVESQLAQASDKIIVTCQWDRFYSDVADAHFPQRGCYRDYASSVELIEDLLNGQMFGVTCYFTPRNIIEKAGKWDESLAVNQDGEYFMRVLAQNVPIIHNPHGKLYYRSNNANSVSRVKINQRKGCSLLKSYRLMKKTFETTGIMTDRVICGLSSSFKSVGYIYSSFPDIVSQAKCEDASLNYNKGKVTIGGKVFRYLTAMFGFWNVVKIKSMMSK